MIAALVAAWLGAAPPVPALAPPTLADAGPLWERCKGGDLDACYLLHQLRTVRIPDAAARAKATGPLEAACAKKDFVACFALAMHLDDDGGLPLDGRWAFTLFGAACRGGFSPACTREATFYVVGPPSREPDADGRALGILRVACDAGWPAACGDHVWLSELRGKPIELPMMIRACDSGAVNACEALGRFAAERKGVGKRTVRTTMAAAHKRLDRLCAGGHESACADRERLGK